jgi:putative PIN family toxin of toxin-antitoxin system
VRLLAIGDSRGSDSNVIVSASLRSNPEAPPVILLDAWRAGRFEIAISQAIIDEVERTLSNRYFRPRVPVERLERIRLLYTLARLVHPDIEVRGVASHPEDDLILSTAVSAEADYLVTGDAGLLAIDEYRGVRIVSPRDFLGVLRR